MRSLLAVLLLSISAVAGEPYAFRISSVTDNDRKQVINHGLSVPVKYDGKKMILTALHVVAGEPTDILVDFPKGWIRCQIIKKDEVLDLCLLAPAIEPPWTISVSDEELKEGLEVLNPNFFARMRMVVNKGTVKERRNAHWSGEINEFANGSSGSPILDKRGKLVGVGIAMLPSKTMAIFVGSDEIRKFLKK